MSHKARTKAQVIHQTGALLLIDDSADNAVESSRAQTDCPVLLFGSYPWNAVVLDPDQKDELDNLTYVDMVSRGLLDKVEERRRKRIEAGWLPDHVERVADWDAAVEWVDRWEASGRPPLRTNLAT